MTAWEDLAPVDRIAEGLWQSQNGIGGGAIATHKAWLALPETERAQWQTVASEVLEDWKKSHGYA